MIGYNAAVPNLTGNYQMSIGNLIYANGLDGSTTTLSTGSVGIGVKTPTAKLDIAGTVKIADGTQGAGKVLTSDAAGLASWQTAAGGNTLSWVHGGNAFNMTGTLGTTDNEALSFITNSTVRMTINSGGSVGIGTTAPVYALDVVRSASADDVMRIKNSNNAGATTIRFDNDSNTQVAYVGTYNSGAGGYPDKFVIGTATKDIIFDTNLGTAGEKMRITSAGKVGIGTNNPTAGLHVASASVASTPAFLSDGAWYTGGSATTTKPSMLIEPSGATSTAWSVAGTGLGVNAASGFVGNLFDLQLNGVSKLSVNSAGSVTVGGTLTVTRSISSSGQIVSAGTTLQNGTTIDFDNGNSLYRTNTCATVDLVNLKDGGSYSYTVQNTSGTCTFTEGSVYTNIHMAGGVAPATGVTITTHTVFSIAKLGTQVYITWVTF
jgi:hypothetical protein